VVGEGLESVEILSVMPSNPEEEFWTREDRRGRGGQGGGWAYRGLVRAEGCREGVGGRWERSERLVGAGEDGSVASAVDDGSSMGGAWGERRPGKNGCGARGGSGRQDRSVEALG